MSLFIPAFLQEVAVRLTDARAKLHSLRSLVGPEQVSRAERWATHRALRLQRTPLPNDAVGPIEEATARLLAGRSIDAGGQWTPEGTVTVAVRFTATTEPESGNRLERRAARARRRSGR